MREFWHSDVAPGPGAGNTLSEVTVTALSGRAEPRWVLAGGRQVPSESDAQRSRHLRPVGRRVGPMLRRLWPVGGRLKFASSMGVPIRFSLRGAHCGPRCPAKWCRAIARAVGCPAVPARLSGRVHSDDGPRARGAAGVFVESWVDRLPADSTRVTGSPSPTRGRPLHRGWLRVGVRVDLLIPKATEGLFKLDALRPLTIHSAGSSWEGGVVGPPRV
jgi:hypothetical protein